MVLFLDFDGTTHPKGCSVDQLFCQMTILAEWLRLNPRIRVVISSSWRQAHPLAELREFFPQDIQARVAGVTPDLAALESDFEREEECRAWLRDNGHNYSSWVALDDQAELFFPGRENLIPCNPSTGLTRLELELAGAELQRQDGQRHVREAFGTANGAPLSFSQSLFLEARSGEQQPPQERESLESADYGDGALLAELAKHTADQVREDAASAAERRAAWLALPVSDRWSTMLLDLDEVLCIGMPNAAATLLKVYEGRCELPQGFFNRLFSPLAVEALELVHQEMDGRIRYAISSSWREHFSREQIEDILRRGGARLVADAMHPGPAWRCYLSSWKPSREEDIELWHQSFHSGEPWVCVDDRHSGGSLAFSRNVATSKLFYRRVVMCEPGVGLLPEHVPTMVDALRRMPFEKT